MLEVAGRGDLLAFFIVGTFVRRPLWTSARAFVSLVCFAGLGATAIQRRHSSVWVFSGRPPLRSMARREAWLSAARVTASAIRAARGQSARARPTGAPRA
jgi:hypothetical protein